MRITKRTPTKYLPIIDRCRARLGQERGTAPLTLSELRREINEKFPPGVEIGMAVLQNIRYHDEDMRHKFGAEKLWLLCQRTPEDSALREFAIQMLDADGLLVA